jgi:hypothetical protein
MKPPAQHSGPLRAALAGAAALALAAPQALAQQGAEPAAAPVQLTAEQRHTVKEIIIKSLKVEPQQADVPMQVGSVVPPGVPLQPIPVEVAVKVPQLRTHSYAVKDDTVIIVDPRNNRIAELVK